MIPILSTHFALIDMIAMPFIMGKLMLALLILLSAISWTIILTKHFQLRLTIHQDKQFASRLRKMAKCLELYERKFVYPNSPLYQIYLAGAKASAMEMIGDQRPEFLAKTQLESINSLSEKQINTVSKAFDAGYKRAFKLLKGNEFRLLRQIALTALMIGIASTFYFMIRALNEFETNNLVNTLIAGIVMVVASFLVALPAEWYRKKYRVLYQHRVNKMIRFHFAINKTFTKQLQKLAPSTAQNPKYPEATIKLPVIDKQKPHYFSLSKKLSADDQNRK